MKPTCGNTKYLNTVVLLVKEEKGEKGRKFLFNRLISIL